LSDLETRIKGEPVTQTPAMKLGAAFHKVAEGDLDLEPYFGSHSGFTAASFYCADGMLFDVDSTDEALALRGPGVAEVWCSRQLLTVPYAPLLRGRSDWLSGIIPYEIKTKEKDFDPTDYAASLQWQCYLHMLSTEECRYLLVRLEERVEGVWWVRDADVLPLFRYVGMEEHINQWATRFMHFCEQRNLLSYLDKELL
ncbi:MAG TPA: hypothetical protein VN444_03995, partial [Verrucomicrobiae bacterium]|nr:hypothetical protein [Verrucomicrobiae bacterium]